MIYKFGNIGSKTGKDTAFFALKKTGEAEANIVACGIGLDWTIHMANKHSNEYDEIQPVWEDNIKDYLVKDGQLRSTLRHVNKHTCGLCPNGEYR